MAGRQEFLRRRGRVGEKYPLTMWVRPVLRYLFPLSNSSSSTSFIQFFGGATIQHHSIFGDMFLFCLVYWRFKDGVCCWPRGRAGVSLVPAMYFMSVLQCDDHLPKAPIIERGTSDQRARKRGDGVLSQRNRVLYLLWGIFSSSQDKQSSTLF